MATVGHVPDVAELNNTLYFNTLALRDALAKVAALWSYIQPLGSAGLQGEPWNMDPAVADAYFQAAEYANTVAEIYTGQIAQPEAFPFSDALAPVLGGQ
jgi:hypothetical protein